MTLQRRSYTSLPPYLQTNRNNLELAVTDDILYEPEQAAFVSGYIGDTSKLTAEDLTRTPRLVENSAIRQKYQFSIGIAQLDPVTRTYTSGAFYDDLLNHLSRNGAFTDDPNRLFSTIYYAWSPPVDYDKITNPARYVWTGSGTATANGEYVTKEAAGSQTILFQFDGTTLVPNTVTVSNGFPGSPSTGDIIEDVSTTDRYLYIWDGTTWNRLNFIVAADANVHTSYNAGDYIYVCRTGPSFNRPLVWVYRPTVGRWSSIPVVVNIEAPDEPAKGMLWEDCSISPSRIFRIYDGSQWILLETGMVDVFDGSSIVLTSGNGPSGVPTVVTYLIDRRAISAVDSWSQQNWWRAATDISASDRDALGNSIQALRPIIEFWGTIETAAGDSRTTRNQFPKFNLYAVSPTTFEIVIITPGNFSGLNTASLVTSGHYVAGTVVSTIFNYVVSTGTQDPVLGFAFEYADDGTPLFDLDMESLELTANNTAILGYRFFRDTATGLVHSVWEKSQTLLQQTADSDGLYTIPENLKSNPDHLLTKEVSRSIFASHFASVMQSQEGFSGSSYGTNNYRFTPKDVTLGALMIDPQESLFRQMAVLQTNSLDIPDAIRTMAREYNSVMTKFVNQLNIQWTNGTIADATDTLIITPDQAVDIVCSIIFAGRNEEFPFFNSVMGTYNPTRITNGVVYQFDPNPQPIYIPNSAAQIGTSPAYTPEIFVDIDGIEKLRGHDGAIIPTYGDARDEVILALENRFFAAIPTYLKNETTTFSSRFNDARFHLDDYYGNYQPTLTAGHVSQVVADYNSVVSPLPNERVYSSNFQVFAIWDGSQWLTTSASTNDVFINDATGDYYIFNGFFTEIISTYNNTDATFDYSTNEYRAVIEREFERWVVNSSLDFITNVEFDESDPFTWNYSSAGVEGNYRGIYRRVYHSVRPHSHPWEVVGYSVRPSWWLTSYVPTSTASDGTPRYANTHPMWTDFQSAIVNPLSGKTVEAYRLLAPIPVDSAGELLDPIASGLILEQALTPGSIGDDWQFGDGALVEEAFYSSYFYQFSKSLAGYLMKPGIFVDRTWSEFYRTIGDTGTNLLWRNPHLVYSNTLNRPQVALVASQLSLDSDGNVVVNPGFNAWIAEYANLIGTSADTNFNNAIVNCAAALGWKTSGFINQKRTRIELLNGDEVPFEDISVILHQGPSTAEYFQSGISIVRDADGFRVFGTDTLNPFFRVDVGATPIAGGRVESIENFTYDGKNRTFVTEQITVPSVTNDTATFSVLINGYRIRDEFIQRINSTSFSIDAALLMNGGDLVTATVITTISNPGTQLGSFTINGTTVTYAQTGTGTLVDYQYGHLFQTLSDVVNMMVGHGRWLSSQGWVFERLTNGSLRDWVGAARAFVIWATNLSLKNRANPDAMQGSIFEFSVMGRYTQFNSNFGMILGVEEIRNGAYGIVDVNNKPIRGSDIEVVSSGDTITVATANTEIFGLRLYVSEVQHVVFFPNTTTFGDIIYEPSLGLVQDALFVDTYRTTNWNGRMEAPGFIILGGQILPNWEKQVNDTTRYYDRFNPVDDPTLLAMSRNLFGYVPQNYMDVLAADDRTAFNFFHGSLKSKGTFQPYRAFIRGTRLGSSNVTIAEDWAWKFARYGDRRNTTVLFSVNEEDFVDIYQVIHFNYLAFSYEFDGDNTTSCFLIPQQFVYNDLVVLLDDELQLYLTDYTISPSGTGYNVCLTVPPVAGQTVTISLNDNLVHARQVAFYQSGPIPFNVDTEVQLRNNNVVVFINGLLQIGGVGYSTSGTEIIGVNTSSATMTGLVFGNLGDDVFYQNVFRGDSFTTDFYTHTGSQTINTVIVAVNGLIQTPNVDYQVLVSGNDSYVSFTSAPALAAKVVVFESLHPTHLVSVGYSFNGNGSSVQFNIPGTTLTSSHQVLVVVNGLAVVGAIPGQSVPFTYSIESGGIRFNSAPSLGASIVVFAFIDVVGEVLPVLSDDRIIQIPQFAPPTGDNRWVVPPPDNIFAGVPYHFPTQTDGSVDIHKYVFTASLVDQTGISPATELFHWDPAQDIHEPFALSKINYKTVNDPARYNQGPLAGPSNGLVWGEAQVGHVWWNTANAIYEDYQGFLPDYLKVSREWGKLKYYGATITRVDETVTVTTLDVRTGQPIAHGLSTGDVVLISGADQPTYNGSIEVTVASSTTFTFIVNVAADTPATGDIAVQIGTINCYEWVASPVVPSAWNDFVSSQSTDFDAYSGTVLNVDNPSYVTREVWDVNGNVTITYYFWVEHNTRTIPGKAINVNDIAGRLKNPAQYEVPYFGIIDSTTMFVFIGADKVSDGDAIEVSYQWYETPRHIEWMLIGEGDNFNQIPALVTDKIHDSILGTDIHDNPVPNVTLSPVEKFGTCYFPAQSVFPDPDTALEIYLDAVNEYLTHVEIQTLADLYAILQGNELTNLNPDGYWSRAVFWKPDIDHTIIFDTVEFLSELDYRTSLGLYAKDDIVKVIQSDQLSLWDATTYTVATVGIANAGTGYSPGDTISLVGGNYSSQALLTVLTVGGVGEILTLTISDVGSYTGIPPNPTITTTSGTGVGFNATVTWDHSPILYAYYQYDGSTWNVVGIEDHTVSINSNLSTSTSTYREFFNSLQASIDVLSMNRIIFSVLFEMLRQNPTCDWFFKTSYIDLFVNQPFTDSAYVRPDEATAIRDAILDLKPFRTKLRDFGVVYTSEEDNITIDIEEQLVDKVTLIFDRVACDLNDENAWDTIPWDATATYPEQSDITITFIGDGSTKCFYLPEAVSPGNLVVYINGILQIPNINYTTDPSTYQLCFIVAPANSAVISVTIDGPFQYFTAFSYEFAGDGVTDTQILPATMADTDESGVFSSWNGVHQSPTADFAVTVPSNIEVDYTTIPPVGVEVTGLAFGGLDSNIFDIFQFTGDGSTLQYSTNLSDLTLDNVVVFVDGIWQVPGTGFILNSTNPNDIKVVFAPAVANGAKIDVYAVNSTSSLASDAVNYIGDGATTLFPMENLIGTVPASVIVNIDGIEQRNPADYSITTDGIVFIDPPVAGSKITIWAVWIGIGERLTPVSSPLTVQWDWAFWDYADLGRQEYDFAGIFIGDGVTETFTVPISQNSTFLYNIQIKLFDNGQLSSAESLGLTYTYTRLATSVVIFFDAPLPTTAYGVLYISRGLYEGLEPSFGVQDPNGITFEPAPVTYEHFFARLIDPPFDPSVSAMTGCPTPEERIKADLADIWSVIVRTEPEDYTPPITLTFTGLEVISQVGTLVLDINSNITLGGLFTTSFTSDFTILSEPDPFAMSGVAVTSDIGTLVVSTDNNIMTGQEAMSAVGTVVAESDAIDIPLVGLETSSDVGNLGITVEQTETGLEATAEFTDITPSVEPTGGVAVITEFGTFDFNIDTNPAMSGLEVLAEFNAPTIAFLGNGLEVTAEVGTLGAVINYGMEAVSAVGSFTIDIRKRVGVQATAEVGTLTIDPVYVVPTGLQVVARVGTMGKVIS